MLRALAVLAAFALLVYAFADFASSDERDRGGIPRWLWLILIVLLPYFGPIAWIVFSRSRRAQAASGPMGGRGGSPRGRGRRRPSGPIAPDDDPDFLWRLAQEQRRQSTAQPPSAPDAGEQKPGTAPGKAPGTPSAAGSTGEPAGDEPAGDDARRDDGSRDDGSAPV